MATSEAARITVDLSFKGVDQFTRVWGDGFNEGIKAACSQLGTDPKPLLNRMYSPPDPADIAGRTGAVKLHQQRADLLAALKVCVDGYDDFEAMAHRQFWPDKKRPIPCNITEARALIARIEKDTP